MQFIENYLDSSQRVNLYFEPRDTNDKTAGLYYHPKPLENDEDELYICSYIEVMALTRDLENLQWGKEILLKDQDHFPHEVVINLEDFAGKCDEILRVLFNCGLILGDLENAQRLLMRYLKTSIPEKRSVRVDRTGWHDKIYIIGEDDFPFIIESNFILCFIPVSVVFVLFPLNLFCIECDPCLNGFRYSRISCFFCRECHIDIVWQFII